jgi:hypothetical protein
VIIGGRSMEPVGLTKGGTGWAMGNGGLTTG